MTDFFKPVAAKQSHVDGKKLQGKPANAVLQPIPNGQPWMPAIAQKPTAPIAKPRRPVSANGSDQPDAKRQRTLGVTATPQHGFHEPRDEQQTQPPAHGASVIDVSMSDVTAGPRGTAPAQDTAVASGAEDVSSQQMTRAHAGQVAPTSAVDQSTLGASDAAAPERWQDGKPPADGLDSGPAKKGAPSSGSLPVSADRSDDDLGALEALGFSRSRAQAALSRCRNDVERAANLLFSGVT